MYVNKYDNNKQCAISGRKAEIEFIQIAKQKGIFFEDLKDNLYEQISSHADVKLLVNNKIVRVDVKGIKNIKRGSNNNKNPIWLEFQNVNGDKGWLFGKSELIAFETNNHFLIFSRIKLIKWCEDNIDLSKKTLFPYEAYKIRYTRQNRKDIISFVYIQDILNLKHAKWSKV